MQLQTEVAEPNRLQAALHDLQGRCLLGHEEHRLTLRQAVADEVGDRLALAGAGRADQHEILTAGGRHHRRQLR